MYILSKFFFFFKQKTAYEMRISDWSSDVCSSDLVRRHRPDTAGHAVGVQLQLPGTGPGQRHLQAGDQHPQGSPGGAAAAAAALRAVRSHPALSIAASVAGKAIGNGPHEDGRAHV